MQRLRSIPSYSTPPAKQSIAGPLYATASASEPRLSPRDGARSPNPALSRSKASASTLLQSTKRRDTGAHEYMQHYATSPRSVRSSPGLGDESLQIIDAADALDAEPPTTEDDSFEGLENVRIVDSSAQSPSPANGIVKEQPQLTRGSTSGAATAIGGHSGSFQVKVR